MAVDEQRLRQSLHTRLAEALGADEAALLMEYLPPVGWADIARRSDLDALQLSIGAVRTELRGEIAELRGEFGELRGEMRGEIRAFRAEVRGEITELKSQLLMWLVPTIIGSVGISVTLSRVL
jgi:hypothetical protein